MAFTRIANIVALILFVLGWIRLIIGFWGASIENAAERAYYARTFFGSKTTGEEIDQALWIILIAIALGTLAEISKNLKK